MATIKGMVKEQVDKTSVPGVSVELFLRFQNQVIKNLKANVDAQGQFAIAFDANSIPALTQSKDIIVLAQVWRNGTESIPVVNNPLITNLELKDYDIDVLVNLPTVVTPPVTPGRFSVEGRITDASGVAVSRLTVTAVDRDLRREELLGSATTDAEGRYQVSYSSAQFTRAEKERADLVVRVIGPDGKTELAKSDTLFNAPASAEVNPTIPADKLHLDSEWERYHRELAPIIENIPVHDLTDADLQFLHGETGIDPTHLRLVRLDVLWRDQQAQLKLPAASFYGLLRQGLPTDWALLLQTGPVRWRAALKQAVADRQVPATLGQISEAFVAQLTELAIDQSFVPPIEESGAQASIGLLLAGSTVSRELQRQIAGIMLNHSPNQDPQQLWDSLAQAGLPDGAVRSTRFVLEAHGLVHQHLPTLAVLQASHARAFGAGADLARLSRVQWLEVAQTVANTGTKSFPKGFDSAEAYAESLADRVELIYPTAVVAHRLMEDSEPARREVGKFLVQNPAFDLLTTPVEAFLKTAKLEKIDTEALTKQLGKEVRLAKLAPATNRAVYMQALQANGFDSTAKVMMAGKLEFTRRMEKAAGRVTRGIEKTAGRVLVETMYSNAKQRAAELTLHTLKLREELEHWSPVFPSAAVAPDSRLATWVDLFGRGDGCFCPPCDSVHGPAAYLMDLFEFLKEMDAKAPVGGQSLLEVLFARRPDLKHLKLNCANAETPLPYIDLVIEHLESLLATLPESGLNATTPQTPETLPDVADVAARLRALPHEPEPPIEALAALYRDGGPLATAVYPWNLPFDRDFLQAGLYLKLIGVSPAEVLELMAKPGDGLHRARLGLSLSLWDRIARGSTAVANAWGLRGENLDQLVNFAGENGVLLARSGLAVDELFALLESPLFAGWNLHIDRASDPCDITHTRLMQRIGGEHARPSELSEVVRTEVFDLMHRVLRLRVALNWPMAKLQSALQALRIGRFSSAIDLVALSRMVALSVQRGVPLEKVAASLQTLDQALDEAPVDSAELAKAQAELAHAQADWLALLQLSAVDHAHLLALGLEDSLTPQEPGQRLERTADALETIALLTAASVDPAELHYLLRHQDLVPAVFMPRENDLEAQLDSVVAAIQNAGVEPPNLPALPADPTELERNRRREEEEARASALSELACLRLTAAEEQLRGITGITLINYVIADAPTGALLAATGTDRTRGVVHDFIALAALATDNSGYVGLRAASKLSLRRVLKTSRLFVMLKATVDDAKAMTGLTRDNTLWLDFNTLPLVPVTETASRPNLSTLKGLLQTSVTQRAMPPADRRLLQVIADATDAATTVADLESITGWGRSVSIPPSAGAWALGGVADLLEIAIVGDTPNWRSPDTYARLQIAIRWLQGHRLTVSPELIPPLNLLISAASGVTVDGLKALARSRFATDADWYKALTPAMDHLRAQQRDALLAHILNTNGHGWKTADDVYEHLLIDVQMGPCQLTSRIVQAHSAVQLFVQRCLMNLEKPEEVALGDVSDITEWRQWDWMKNYRVWEAGRKVFLYPENWIEPDLRDVKSPFFEELENELLQDEITPDMVERTVRTYLTKLHEVARLDIRALYEETYQERSGDGSDVTRKVIHMVGRTHAVPHIHYYRQRLDDLSWAPWEKLDLSIDADHLVLAVVNRRPMLFWPQFNEVQLDRNDPTTLALDMKLNWTTLEFGHWSAPTKSAESVRVDIKDRSTLMLRPEVTGARLTLHVYNLMRIPHPRENWPLGYGISIFAFSMDGCTADLKLVRLDRARVLRLPRAVLPHNQLLKESVVSSSVTYLRFMDEGEPLGWLNPDSIAQLQEIAETGGLGGVIFAAFLAVALVHRDAAAYGESSVPLLNGPIEGFTLLPAHQFPRLAIGQPYVLTHSEHPLYAFQSPRSGWYLQPKYLLESGHHPFVCDLLEAVRSEGMDGLYRPAEITRVLFFPTRHQVVRPARPDRYPRQVERRNTERVLNDLRPNPFLVAESYPVDEFDFSTRGAYGIYNWELFFHIPLLLADRLSKNGRFADAQRWFHTIFDPTDVSPHPASQKYWRVKPLFAECESRSAPEAIRTLEEMMRRLSNGGADLEQQVEAWRNDPFNPHMLARMRLVAYMKTVVQKYIENLIAWADSLFRRDTMESINEATQLYVLGNHILGGAPVALPPMQRTARSYAELISEHSVDAFANVLIDIDISLPLSAARLSRSERPAAGVSMLYFCIPSNARLSELRTTIADRLFKIRHCMDIEGRTRQLALFAPPIDPALLVRARAAGLDIGTALSMALGARTPHYRFQPLLQKALEFCHEVRSFGNALLSALEKRDGEVLAQLHSRHEVGMLKRVSEIKRQQIEEAEAGLEGVHRSKSVVQARLDFFAGNLQAFTSPSETAQIADLDRAHNAELTSAALSLGASIAYAFPDIALGMTSFVKVGGTNIGNALRAGASIASIVAQQHTFDASMAGFKASHERRADEWRHQVETATRELAQIDQQIIAAEIRLNIAKQDQRNHEAQIADAEEVLAMQRDKFTNAQLYSWMSAQLAALHYQSYRMAFDLAKQAEAAADYELETGTLIRFDHWDAGRRGLLAGERLAQDLRRLETPYLDRNTRELEITKHVSLRQLDPVALIALRLSGQCTFHVPEALFDLDFPGHYFRRIKSVSMSVPCVAGPYTSVSGTLTLQESSIRRRPLVPEPKQLLSGPLQSIATSSGQNDGGLFELNFRDERYLPFEGRGAESTWQFSLPTKFRSFDYDTIADLVLHVRYTARDGDPEYSASVSSNLTRALNAISTEGLRLLVSVRHDFPAEWRALQVEGDDARREIRIDASLFPYFVRESFDITAVHTITSGERVDPPLFINGSTSRTTTATVEISRLMEYLLVSYSIARDGV